MRRDELLQDKGQYHNTLCYCNLQPGIVSSQQWAGIISCHTEQGWYPSATFVDIRGECGLSDRIIGTGIENLKLEIKNAGE